MTTKELLANVLRTERKRLELSLEEFADRLGISRSSLIGYLNGSGNPSLETLDIITAALNQKVEIVPEITQKRRIRVQIQIEIPGEIWQTLGGSCSS